jgi:tetratricopeptide (TPR) repeat protein
MKRQKLVAPRSLAKLFAQAAEAWKRQDYQQSIDILERATRLDPSNPRILLDLGRAHGLRYNYGDAERCFDKAVRVAPRRAETLAASGRRCQEFGNDAMAASYFGRAALEHNAPPEVFVAVAESCERQARLEDAAHWVDRALAAQAHNLAALLVRARLQRLRGQFDDAESTLRPLVAAPSADGMTRTRLLYELGTILDRQGNYDGAMATFLEAKRLLRPAAAAPLQTLEGIQARVQEMEASISTALFDRWRDAHAALGPARRLAVLCGHPRSGTTLLEQLLDSHQEIVAAEETHLFHDEAYLPLTRGISPDVPVIEMLEAAGVGALEESRRDYFQFTELFLGQAIAGRLLIDKNPALNVLIPAVARIFPEARFLVAIRDPRDVCLSCFMQPLPLNPVSSAYLTLEGTVRQFISVMGFWRSLAPMLKNDWIEVRYEDLVGDLETTARHVLGFLGLPWSADVLRFHEHARTKLLRSRSYADVTQPIFRRAVGRWRNYEKYLEPWMGPLDRFVAAYGYT